MAYVIALLALLAADAVVADVDECLSEVEVEATELATAESSRVEFLYLRASRSMPAESAEEVLDQTPLSGNNACKCVGISGVSGMTNVTINGQTINYPRELGSTCKAWDAGRHPDCNANAANKPETCALPWCFVDPCQCNLTNLPRRSSYIPNGRIRGLQLYKSYATCAPGGSYSGDTGDAAQLLADCMVPTNSDVIGDTDCPCVGVANRTGSLDMTIDGTTVSYPADAGSYCKIWHAGQAPKCDGSASQPAYCTEKWCYVDPCACTANMEPANFLPGATIGGQPLQKSSATCGGNATTVASGAAYVPPASCASSSSSSSGTSSSSSGTSSSSSGNSSSSSGNSSSSSGNSSSSGSSGNSSSSGSSGNSSSVNSSSL